MNSRGKIGTIYHRVVAVVVCLFLLGLIYMRFRGQDIYSLEVTNAGYQNEVVYAQNGDRILAEGCEIYYLYPGSYELSILTGNVNSEVYYQVYDKFSDRVLAEQINADGESEQTLVFATDKVYADVVVRSLTAVPDYDIGQLDIINYCLNSDGPVGTDRIWRMGFLVLLGVLCCYGYWRLRQQGRPAVLILTMASMLASLPFYSATLQHGHDISFHLTRIANIGQAIAGGYFPERIDTLSAGIIIPIMYPELLLAGAGFMVSTGATSFLAYKVFCTFTTFGAAFIAYYAARQVVEERPALFCAMFWLFNPFRLNELLLRGELGEAPAIMFLPLIAIGMWQIFHDSARKGGMHLILGYTGALACHVLMPVIAATFCAIYVIYQLVSHPLRFVHEIRRIVWLVLAAVVTVLLNLYYLVPFLRYYGWDFVITREADYGRLQTSASPIWQLFMGAVDYADFSQSYERVNNEMALSIGTALLLTVVTWVMYDAYRSHDPNGMALRTTVRAAAWDSWLLGICGVFMASLYFPWDFVCVQIPIIGSTLGKMQFSWRFLMIPVLLLSFLMGILVMQLLLDRSVIARMAATILCVLVSVDAINVATTYYSEVQARQSDHFTDYYNRNGDYILADVSEQHGNDINEWLDSYWGPVALDDNAKVTISDYHRDGAGYTFVVSNAETGDAVVTVPLFWYGLHTAVLTDATGETEIPCVMNADYQFSDVAIPAGTNEATVRLIYAEPASFRIAYGISGVTLVVLVAGAIVLRERKVLRM